MREGQAQCGRADVWSRNDLISIGEEWSAAMPDTAFVAPHAPEICEIYAGGYQWFSIQDINLGAFERDKRAEKVRPVLDAYIDEVVARYRGRLQSWDVVNEPFWPGHRAPGGFRLGPWYDAFGADYVRRAFVRAAQADPKTKLVLNEAQTERDDEVGLAVRAGLLKLVADLKHAGVKLDVVGLQGHLQPQYPHDPARFDKRPAIFLLQA